MKKIFLTSVIASVALVSCGTVQSLVQNTFPYTTNVMISTGVPVGQDVSSTATASNIQNWFGGNNNAQIKNVRIADAKVSITSPAGANLSAIKSVKVYLSSNGSNERLVASRSDISSSSDAINLDIANSNYLDDIVKTSGVTIRTVYQLKNQVSSDTNMRVSINFSSVPAQ